MQKERWELKWSSAKAGGDPAVPPPGLVLISMGRRNCKAFRRLLLNTLFFWIERLFAAGFGLGIKNWTTRQADYVALSFQDFYLPFYQSAASTGQRISAQPDQTWPLGGWPKIGCRTLESTLLTHKHSRRGTPPFIKKSENFITKYFKNGIHE